MKRKVLTCRCGVTGLQCLRNGASCAFFAIGRKRKKMKTSMIGDVRR